MLKFWEKKHSSSEEKFQFTEEVITAVLDHRTSVVCGVLDGKTYKAGEGPKPPFHSMCRCIRLPHIDTEHERSFVDPVEKARPKAGQSPFYESLGKTPVAKRKVGKTKDNYIQWFDKQKSTKTGRKFQELKLGEARYKAYKAEELSLEDMVNLETLEMYSLKDLGLE